MRVFIGADPGGQHLGYIFPFSLMMKNYLTSKGHHVTLDAGETVDIALCIAFKPTYEQVKALKYRGARIVHRLDGRVRSIVKAYDQDEEVRKINKLADWTVFQSEYVKRHTTLPETTIFGIEAPICTNIENSSIIYNGVDRSIFNEVGDRFTLKGKINILHVAITGGIRKGAKYVFKIAEHLKNNPDIHFYLIGNQDKDLSCGHLIGSGEYPNVTHLGPILDQRLLAKYMRSCQVLLFPSVDDYCPNVVIEAMSCGLPVWYHNSGGTPELVRRGRHVGGVPITPENDIQPLYVLINDLDDFRKGAIEIVRENFTSDIIGQQYLELFERLLASPRPIGIDVPRDKILSPSSIPKHSVSPKKQSIVNKYFVRAVEWFSQKLFMRAASLYPRLVKDNASATLLKFWMQSRALPKNITPDSSAGRDTLQYWFGLQSFVEGQINQVCNLYYDYKHPKHYFWLGHNQYLFDEIKAGERVLDIGCGASYYQQWIAEKALKVVAVDILPERVELAQRNNKKPNVFFQVMDVNKELPAGEFDVVICSHVLEHLDDPITMLRSLAQKVPRLIVKVPLSDSHWMKLVKQDIGMFWMDDPTHRREYTEKMLREQLEACGWRIQKIIRGYDLRATALSIFFTGNEHKR
jgi:glycosyltransferase involved in cell wall biosynthesis/SAM-dependent methyltransferase